MWLTPSLLDAEWRAQASSDELIDEYENRSRAFYGGAIGFMDFDGNYNHAIIIRSFLSKNNVLHYQAGAGVVSESKPEMNYKKSITN